jgi:SsrA-binding protein
MLLAKNRKAFHNYEILEKYLAGIELRGYEVKAVREGKATFESSYIKFINNRPYVVGMHIGKYSKQSQDPEGLDTRRSRALLLNARELDKLRSAMDQKGKTAIPLALVLRNNMIKLELATVKGRKKYEKKVVAKEKQVRKDLEKYNKDTGRNEGMTRI